MGAGGRRGACGPLRRMIGEDNAKESCRGVLMVLAEVIGCCTSLPSSLVKDPDLLERTAWVRK